MFLKRFLTLSFIGISIVACAGKLSVSVTYVKTTLENQAEPVYLAAWVQIGPKGAEIQFEKTDSSFRNWTISGSGYEGGAELYATKKRGIGWMVYSGGDTLKVLIARDYRNTHDPRMITLTTSFTKELFVLENHEPDCNSAFKIYALADSKDADVEYTGDYAVTLRHSDPCGNGKWQAKTGKLKIPRKVLYVAIFSAIVTQNIRHLFKRIAE